LLTRKYAVKDFRSWPPYPLGKQGRSPVFADTKWGSRISQWILASPTGTECAPAGCQLLAYHVALLRGCEVDRPRNLAKSVTME
jgi:hypothetical protein